MFSVSIRDMHYTSPESSLREAINEIVLYHAEPTFFFISPPILIYDEASSADIELGHEIEFSPDTLATADYGRFGARILTRELFDTDLDEQQPFHMIVRASHDSLGTVFTHITVPDIPLPDLRPAKRQKGRPSIASSVESDVFTDFERDVLMNEVSESIVDPKETLLFGTMRALLMGVPKERGKNIHMTERHMMLTEEILNMLFWNQESTSQAAPIALRRYPVLRKLFPLQ